MVCGLFSSFDPSVYSLMSLSYFPMKWLLSLMVVLTFSAWRVFVLAVSKEVMVKSMLIFSLKEVEQSMKSKKVGLVLFGIFFSICMFNIVGLIPFNFTVSSHFSVNLSISLSMWIGGLMVSVFKSFDFFLSHMVPVGSPEFLWFLLVLVESVSLLIRPITLSIRLMANVMAGHLIMSLVGGFGSSLMMTFFFFPLFVEVGFLMFEVCVSIVQAYVFKSLLTLYWSESN